MHTASACLVGLFDATWKGDLISRMLVSEVSEGCVVAQVCGPELLKSVNVH